MLTERLMKMTIAAGSEWVMVVLLILSVLSIAVIIERARYFARRGRQLNVLQRGFSSFLEKADFEGAQKMASESGERLVRLALQPSSAEPLDDLSSRLVVSELAQERLAMEARLTFLGTLGNNAPFIGLFGTVLGIIRAFHDLSLNPAGGSGAVMTGISEALVATAIGLFVAIPAVIAFNYFQKRVDVLLSTWEALTQSLAAVAQGSATKRSLS